MEIYQTVLLSILAAQTVTYVLLAKYIFQRPGSHIDSMVLVLLIEVCKLKCSLVVFLYEVKSLSIWIDGLWSKALEKTSLLKVAALSLVYVAQNNAAYVALKNMGAARFQVTYQIKIPITALLCVLILKKGVSRGQWLSVGLLTVGVALLQLDRVQDQESFLHSETAPSDDSSKARSAIGVTCLLLAALLSSFAGVYNEKLLKDSSCAIWIVNIQMYTTGVVFSVCAILFVDPSVLVFPKVFHALDINVAVLVFLGSAGGMVVSLVLKHTDNILKSFAIGISIIISASCSSLIFSERFGISGASGVALVSLAIPLYAMFPERPKVGVQGQEKINLLLQADEPKDSRLQNTHCVS